MEKSALKQPVETRGEEKARYLNIPNTLSFIRIATAPFLVWILLSPGRFLSVTAAVVFSVVCLTDWLDGYLARKMNIITNLGKFLDPLADKLLITTAFIMLIPLGRAPAWMVALMVGREMAVTGLRAVASDSGIVIAAGNLGKLKTVFQIAAIIPLLIHYHFYGIDFEAIGNVLLWFAFFLTIWSGVDYFIKFFRKHSLS